MAKFAFWAFSEVHIQHPAYPHPYMGGENRKGPPPSFVKCAAARGAGAGEWGEGRTTERTLLHPAPSCH
jgi:hypothetical protein